MKKTFKHMVLFLELTLIADLAFAQEKKEDESPVGEVPVNVQYDEAAPAESDLLQYSPPIEQLLQNPALAGGIESGSDALNKSVESLMDSLFYSMLDNERNIPITDHSWFNVGLDRRVYSTPSGSYVVTDRFKLGPNYFKELWRVHNIPVNLGVDGRVEVLQIYIRTDGQRLAEQEDLGPIRKFVNSWFGLLPLAARVLPPSFNQNELYDPIKQLETPFSFPFSKSGFNDMPVGSLKSYTISGGIRIPIDFGGFIDTSSQDLINDSLGFSHSLPYSVFRRGEYRINVLRRSENIGWVGVTKTEKVGQSVSPFVGSQFNILKGALAATLFDWSWVWSGVPVVVVPLEINFELSTADVFDQVYEFDLSVPEAQAAYSKAVQGDFSEAYLRYLDAKEKNIPTGVQFHFARNQDRNELISKNGPNLAMLRTQRQRDLHSAEVEITDGDGKYYVLEATQDVVDKKWDILVGEEEIRLIQTVELKVNKVIEDPTLPVVAESKESDESGVKDSDSSINVKAEVIQKNPSYKYRLEAVDDPYVIDVSMNIQDRYVDTDEYSSYLKLIKFTSGIDLSEAPIFERTDPQRHLDNKRRNFFVSPSDSIRHLHTPATHLGRFGAQISIHFPYATVKEMINAPNDRLWAAIGETYGEPENPWRSEEYREALTTKFKWYKSFFAYPFRLFNLRSARVDLIKEGTQIADALKSMQALTDPMELIESFHRLFDTDYPMHLVRVLMNVVNNDVLSKRVTFSAQPKGPGGREINAKYGKLNNMVVREGPQFPAPGRYATSKLKLSNFYLDRPREAKDSARIGKIQVVSKSIPDSVRSLYQGAKAEANAFDHNTRHVFASVSVLHAKPDRPIKLYIRIEQAGRVKIGKLELIEEVLELSPTGSEGESLDQLTYDLFLTGPLSPFTGYMYEQMVVDGGEFGVTLAVSRDGRVWSDEKSVEFRFEGGRLLPVK
jgi:hypothetical protein